MDPGLVMRAQRGDEVAFAAITQASHGRLKQVAYRILRDRHLAEDAMQQAFVEIWRKLPSLRDPARFDAWSYRVLVHACYREAKRHRRSLAQVPDDREPVGPDGTAAVNDRDQLERGFARLSIDHRAVVVMHYFLDLTIEDTAATLGISVRTAKSRLNHHDDGASGLSMIAMSHRSESSHITMEPRRAPTRGCDRVGAHPAPDSGMLNEHSTGTPC